MVIRQGDVWWADSPAPTGSDPGYRRPVVVVQSDTFNAGRLATVVCVAITGNLKWANAPGNVLLKREGTGLLRDSVANVTQLLSLDRSKLLELAGRLPARQLDLVLSGVALVLRRA